MGEKEVSLVVMLVGMYRSPFAPMFLARETNEERRIMPCSAARIHEAPCLPSSSSRTCNLHPPAVFQSLATKKHPKEKKSNTMSSSGKRHHVYGSFLASIVPQILFKALFFAYRYMYIFRNVKFKLKKK